MQDIHQAIDKQLLKSELNETTFLRKTNKGDNELYIVNHKNSPNIIKEIGRLREVSFRSSGGGTGNDLDLDDYDFGNQCYQQLIVWDNEAEEIIGGYRYIKCKDAYDENGGIHLSTNTYFDFSNEFVSNYLPYTIELGRSFVQPMYQSSEGNRKGIFSLDNLWDGLGALSVIHKDCNYFFGKVTMYKTFNALARDYILGFMHYYFPDHAKLVVAKQELDLPIVNDIQSFLNEIKDTPYKDGHIILSKKVRELGENIPPLINSYMNLSSTMKTFGTALNNEFGAVEETGILVDIRDIYDSKKERHINTFVMP